MNNITPTSVEHSVNTAKTIVKEAPKYAETIKKNISTVVDTASTQSAKVTKLSEPATKAKQGLNSAAATNVYQRPSDEPFFKIINQDGQKILVTSNMENPQNAIVTFFNDGKPGKTFECAFDELGSRCGIHI